MRMSSLRQLETFEERTPVEGLEAQVITDFEGMAKLESGWRMLHETNDALSIFSSYDFIYATCQLYLSRADTPFIIALYARGKLVAIIPLCLIAKKQAGIPFIAVENLGCLVGYNPGISTVLDEKETWMAVHAVLQLTHRPWHVIQLGEMKHEEFSSLPWPTDPRFSCFLLHDRIGFQVDLQGTFDQYLAGRSRGARRDYRKYLRLTEERVGTPALVEYTGPAVATEGFDRYGELERKSHKFERKIALTGDARRTNFFRVLCKALAATNSARLYFWTAGGIDLAGTFILTHGSKVYGMEICFNKTFSAMTPAIVLRTEVLSRLFEKGFREFDMLGLHPKYGNPSHKKDWATVKRDTFRFTAVPKRSRLAPWLWLQKWKIKEGLIPFKGIESEEPHLDAAYP